MRSAFFHRFGHDFLSMPLLARVGRSNSIERADSVGSSISSSNESASATELSPHAQNPAVRRVPRRHSTGQGSPVGQRSPGQRSLSAEVVRPTSPTMSDRIARRISRSIQGDEPEEDNDPATLHEENCLVSGHTIHSFQPASPLLSPTSVSRQPTPVIMGDRLTSAPSPLQMSPPPSCGKAAEQVDHAAVRLTAGGAGSWDARQPQTAVGSGMPLLLLPSRRDREDEIEEEIMGVQASGAVLTSQGLRPAAPDCFSTRGAASEWEAIDAHTIRRISSVISPGALPPAPAGVPAGAPAGASRFSSLHVETSVTADDHPDAERSLNERMSTRERKRRPSLGDIRHDEFHTYQEEQQEVAVIKMHEVAQGQVSFLDKLERVRRGDAFRWRRHSHRENVLDTFGRGALGQKIAGRPSKVVEEGDPLSNRPTPDVRTEFLHAAAPTKGSYEKAADNYESYQFDEPESKLHFEERVDDSGKTAKTLQLLLSTTVIIFSIGGFIGLTSAFIAIVEGHIFSSRYSLVMSLLWPCCRPIAEHADDLWWLHGSASMDCSGCLATHAANASSTTGDVAVAAVAFVGSGAALMLGAALLCVWAPRASLSGLPQVKACRAALSEWSRSQQPLRPPPTPPLLTAPDHPSSRASPPALPRAAPWDLGPRGGRSGPRDAADPPVGCHRAAPWCPGAHPASSTPRCCPRRSERDAVTLPLHCRYITTQI